MPRDALFQDYWLTDPSFKLIGKSDDKTAVFYIAKRRLGENASKRHAGVGPENKEKNRKLRTPVTGVVGLFLVI